MPVALVQGLKLQLAETKIRLQYVAAGGTVSEIWDVMGVPMSSLGEGALMDTEACVDAALKGLDDGEFFTAPSAHDETLVQKYVDASETLLAASQHPSSLSPRLVIPLAAKSHEERFPGAYSCPRKPHFVIDLRSWRVTSSLDGSGSILGDPKVG
jgi:hypothetical protein